MGYAQGRVFNFSREPTAMQRKRSRKPDVASVPPTAKQIIEYELPLRKWTSFAAQSFALFRGANLALDVEPYDPSAARDLANRFRMEAALMTIIRLSALFDSDQKSISFQAVNRGLKSEETCDDLVRAYVGDKPLLPVSRMETECRSFQDGFKAAYATIDWEAHGRLQSFRNTHIAHISAVDASRKITYGELDKFARTSFQLQQFLSLMTEGLNTSTEEDTELWVDDYKEVWVKAFETSLH